MRIFYSLFFLLQWSIFSFGQLPIENILKMEELSAIQEIKIDQDGNLIVLGHFSYANSGIPNSINWTPPPFAPYRNLILLKLHKDGEVLWSKLLDDIPKSNEICLDVDQFNHIFLMTYQNEFRLREYDPEGALLTTHDLSNTIETPIYNHRFSALLVTEDAVYLSGVFADSLQFGDTSIHQIEFAYDSFLAKFTRKGKLIWLQYFDTSASGICALKKDRQGNIILGASTYQHFKFKDKELVGTSSFIVVAKFRPNGQLVWMSKIEEETNEHCYDMALDKQDNIYVAGAFGYHPLVVKLNQEGQTIWKNTTGYLSNIEGYGVWNGIALTDQGQIYLAGAMQGTLIYEDKSIISFHPLSVDLMLGQYDAEGKLKMIQNFPDSLNASWRAIAYTNQNIYLGGYTDGSFNGPNHNLMSLDKLSIEADYPDFWHQSQSVIYPNPNKGQFCVYLNETWLDTKIDARLYDNLGRLIIKENPQAYKVLYFDFKFLPSGNYYLSLSNSKDRIIKKVAINN